MPKASKSCPKSNKLPDLVTLAFKAIKGASVDLSYLTLEQYNFLESFISEEFKSNCLKRAKWNDFELCIITVLEKRKCDLLSFSESFSQSANVNLVMILSQKNQMMNRFSLKIYRFTKMKLAQNIARLKGPFSILLFNKVDGFFVSGCCCLRPR